MSEILVLCESGLVRSRPDCSNEHTRNEAARFDVAQILRANIESVDLHQATTDAIPIGCQDAHGDL